MHRYRWFVVPVLVAGLLAVGGCRAGKVTVHGALPQGHSGDAQHADEDHAGSPLQTESPVLDLRKSGTIQGIVPELLDQRVVFVGETHDNYAHHLMQLEIIRSLHRENPDLAIGMEMFQRPFQPVLDAYIAGEVDEAGMLAGTEWFDRWIYDYRLYRPILQFAREQGIPLVALNISKEIREKVSGQGIDGLAGQERLQIPREIDRSDKEYESRLRGVFEKHDMGKRGNFERFMDVQLLWDETMAEQVASYLQRHPERAMVVLAGGGHLMYGSGIPNRVRRRVPVKTVTVLPGAGDLSPGIADFVVYPSEAKLPKAGLMGVYLENNADGLKVSGVSTDSPAEKAGLEKDDRILSINDREIKSLADLKIEMYGKRPGDDVQVRVLRKRLLLDDKVIAVRITLGE
jgi:uncharacterized iron-regulated protein